METRPWWHVGLPSAGDVPGDTLTSRNNLAYAHESAGDLGRAIPLYEQTLTDRVRALGPHHPTGGARKPGGGQVVGAASEGAPFPDTIATGADWGPISKGRNVGVGPMAFSSKREGESGSRGPPLPAETGPEIGQDVAHGKPDSHNLPASRRSLRILDL
jgi:hypothetical protein